MRYIQLTFMDIMEHIGHKWNYNNNKLIFAKPILRYTWPLMYIPSPDGFLRHYEPHFSNTAASELNGMSKAVR